MKDVGYVAIKWKTDEIKVVERVIIYVSMGARVCFDTNYIAP